MDNLFAMDFDISQVNAVSNLGLAHVGDGVYELMVRVYLCSRGDKTVKRLHKDTVELVNASAQARFAEKLLPHLNEQEQTIFRRGKNAHTHAAPKAASARDYALATGLETLFGALYLQGQTQRLNTLFQILFPQEQEE